MVHDNCRVIDLTDGIYPPERSCAWTRLDLLGNLLLGIGNGVLDEPLEDAGEEIRLWTSLHGCYGVLETAE